MIHLILQNIVWLFVKGLTGTYRIELRGQEHFDSAMASGPYKNFIIALWHEQVVSIMKAHMRTLPYLVLASRSKDGDYAAFVASKMGFLPVRGSSAKRGKDKGGKAALVEFETKTKEGLCSAMTVDGPKGPRNKCKPGVPIIARSTGAPILPVASVANKYWEFNSWDKFQLPKPFSRIIVSYGSPIIVRPDDEIDQVCLRVDNALNELTQKLKKEIKSP
jgi:hypothetical protein